MIDAHPSSKQKYTKILAQSPSYRSTSNIYKYRLFQVEELHIVLKHKCIVMSIIVHYYILQKLKLKLNLCVEKQKRQFVLEGKFNQMV